MSMTYFHTLTPLPPSQPLVEPAAKPQLTRPCAVNIAWFDALTPLRNLVTHACRASAVVVAKA